MVAFSLEVQVTQSISLPPPLRAAVAIAFVIVLPAPLNAPTAARPSVDEATLAHAPAPAVAVATLPDAASPTAAPHVARSMNDNPTAPGGVDGEAPCGGGGIGAGTGGGTLVPPA